MLESSIAKVESSRHVQVSTPQVFPWESSEASELQQIFLMKHRTKNNNKLSVNLYTFQRHIPEHCQTSKMKHFAKIVNC